MTQGQRLTRLGSDRQWTPKIRLLHLADAVPDENVGETTLSKNHQIFNVNLVFSR